MSEKFIEPDRKAIKALSAIIVDSQYLNKPSQHVLTHQGPKNDEYTKNLSRAKAIIDDMDKNFTEFKENFFAFVGE